MYCELLMLCIVSPCRYCESVVMYCEASTLYSVYIGNRLGLVCIVSLLCCVLGVSIVLDMESFFVSCL